MSDSAKKSSQSKSSSSQTSNVNSQIIDSIKEINELLNNQEEELKSISNQVLTQTVSMAMLNVVNQQQQLYILQNTATTVAVKAMLESNPEEAVKLMNSVIDSNNVTQELKDLKDLLADLTKK
jgi:hypothetical protein